MLRFPRDNDDVDSIPGRIKENMPLCYSLSFVFSSVYNDTEQLGNRTTTGLGDVMCSCCPSHGLGCIHPWWVWFTIWEGECSSNDLRTTKYIQPNNIEQIE